MARANDRYRIPVQRRGYYSIRVRATTAVRLYRAGSRHGVPLSGSWDERLNVLAGAVLDPATRGRNRG